ncbi:hypothetical protein K435DRAFT_484876 [Dendrothele bispora CBS 962.96]|uniref:Uncharacterized protein n=1 Tax=Dendrothele bispora (strain CBS 962.96) TaxID=1314807 RepID=A0A4S8MB73_DENBC|nr:hypothetical protein K435DRAFT_484876 [Dendrothele bispora CBS 962.96]
MLTPISGTDFNPQQQQQQHRYRYIPLSLSCFISISLTIANNRCPTRIAFIYGTFVFYIVFTNFPWAYSRSPRSMLSYSHVCTVKVTVSPSQLDCQEDTSSDSFVNDQQSHSRNNAKSMQTRLTFMPGPLL